MAGQDTSVPTIAPELREEVCEGWRTVLMLQIWLYGVLAVVALVTAFGIPGLLPPQPAGFKTAALSAAGLAIHFGLRILESRKSCPVSAMIGFNLGNAGFGSIIVWVTGVHALSYLLVYNTFMTVFLYHRNIVVASGCTALVLLTCLAVLMGLRGVDDMAVFGWTIIITVAGIIITGRLRQQAGRIYTHSREKLALQEAFGRFTGDFMTRRALQGGVDVQGERREVTVLFTDLRGFTTLSEGMQPHDLVGLINEHMEMSVRAIEANGGHVNKFIGDAVFAIFGAPDRNPWHRLDAVKAALALRTALVETNAKRTAEGRPALKMGIGIHAGEVVIGLVGSKTRTEFTAMGDTVNVASRLESMCKERGSDLLISGSVAESLDSSFQLQELEPAQVRGRTEPVRLFTIPA